MSTFALTVVHLHTLQIQSNISINLAVNFWPPAKLRSNIHGEISVSLAAKFPTMFARYLPTLSAYHLVLEN